MFVRNTAAVHPGSVFVKNTAAVHPGAVFVKNTTAVHPGAVFVKNTTAVHPGLGNRMCSSVWRMVCVWGGGGGGLCVHVATTALVLIFDNNF